MTVSISTLYSVATAQQYLDAMLDFAAGLALPVTSWRDDDPTLVMFRYLAEQLAQKDLVDAEFIKAGFLSASIEDWKTVVASEIYGIDRDAATYATSTITLVNAGGGIYTPAAGEVTVKDSTSGKTYHSIEDLSLGAGATATLDVEADEAGTDSNAAVNEIDEIVTTMLGVTIAASTVAVAQDAQSDESLDAECLNTLGALSPNGPPDAYVSVVTSSELTGSTEITRAQASQASTTGEVTVYVASAVGAASAPAIALAQAAVEIWATPIGFTPTVVAATEVPVDIEVYLDADDFPAGIEAAIETAIQSMIYAASLGDTVSIGAQYATVYDTAKAAGMTKIVVSLVSPEDVVLAEGEVATPGDCTVHLGAEP